MLVWETLRMCTQYLTSARREESEENRYKTYHSLVLQGNLQTAVRWITDQETGEMLQPAELCTKTRERVMEMLRTKHLDACPLTVASLDTYPDHPPEFVPVGITNNTVTEVVERLYGGAGMGGGGLSEPTALAPAFRCGEQGTTADC